MQNKARKRQQHNCSGRGLRRLAAMARKRAAASLVFVLCFLMVFTAPVYAASKGQVHHEDTADYCMRAGNVNVKLSELQGLDNSQKQALVEKTSEYAFYKWEVAYFIKGDSVSATGDFSSVDWNRAGSYTITVELPPVRSNTPSKISYTLNIIDDHPAEPDPKPPVMYRVTVRYIEEETGLSLKDDYVSEEMEEGSSYEISGDILLPPEDYEVVEIQGDLQGTINKDKQIIVLCRKLKQEPEDPDDPTPSDPDNPTPSGPDDPTPSGPDDPTPADPDDPTPPGPDDPTPADPDDPSPEDPKEQDGQDGKEDGNKDDPSGKSGGNSGKNKGNSGKNKGNSGKGSGGGKGKGSGKSGSSSSSSGSKNSAGQGTARPSAPAADSQSIIAAEEAQIEEHVPAAENVLSSEEAEMPAEETAENAPETDAGSIDMAAAGTKSSSDDSTLGGAILPQADMKKEKYPMWSLTLGAAEGGILAVLGAMILSDLKVILWFEEKKKR